MKLFGSITIIAAAILMISCGNAAETGKSSDQSKAPSADYQSQEDDASISQANVSDEIKETAATTGDGKTKEINDKPVHLTKDEFLEKVMNYQVNKTEWKFEGDLPCIIDFYADWCRPCKMIAPIMDELAKEYKGKINIYKVNTEKEKELAAAFGIRSIPSLLFCPMDGNPQMTQGALSKDQYEKMINDYLLKTNQTN